MITSNRCAARFRALFAALLVFVAAGRGLESLRGQATERTAALKIFVATDIHYLAPELRDTGEAFRAFMASGDGRQLDYVDEIVEAFARDIGRLQPDVLILAGDLTTNGEKQSHETLAEKLTRIERSSGTRVFVIPGNHDIQNPWARGFKGQDQYRTDAITRDEFRSIYRDFGHGEAVSSDKTTLSYLAAPSEDTWLLMLDTNEYRFNRMLGRPATRGTLSEETLEWIRQCSERAKQRHARIITVMHHNLAVHSEPFQSGYTIENSAAIGAAFGALGLDVVLSGHLHIQDIKRVDGGSAPVYDIATSALSIYPQQYGVLEVSPSDGAEYRTARVDVEAWARETRTASRRLRTFRASSRQHFVESSYRKTDAALAKTGRVSAQDRKLMAKTMSELNADYFAGTAYAVKDEVVASRGYGLWVAATEPAFLKTYVLSMIPKTAADNNRVTIPARTGPSR